MNEERSHSCGVASGIKFCVLALAFTITAIHCPALTPAATADNLTSVLNYEVRPISNKLPIDTEHRTQCCIELRA